MNSTKSRKQLVLIFALLLLGNMALLILFYYQKSNMKSLRDELKSSIQLNQRLQKIHGTDSTIIDSLNNVIDNTPYKLLKEAQELIDSGLPLEINSSLIARKLNQIIDDKLDNPYKNQAQSLLNDFSTSIDSAYNTFLRTLDNSSLNDKISALRDIAKNENIYDKFTHNVYKDIYRFEFLLIKYIYGDKIKATNDDFINSLDSIIQNESITGYLKDCLHEEQNLLNGIWMEAEELAYQYNNNPIKTHRDYGDKDLYVSGKVKKIYPLSQYDMLAKFINAIFSIRLPEGGTFVNLDAKDIVIRCYVNDLEGVSNLRGSGDLVMVKGTFHQELFRFKFTKDLLKQINIDISEIIPDFSPNDIFLINCKLFDKAKTSYSSYKHTSKLPLIFYDEIDISYQEFIDRISIFYRVSSQKEAKQIFDELDELGFIIGEIFRGRRIKEGKKTKDKEFDFVGEWKSTSGNEFKVEFQGNKYFYFNVNIEKEYQLIRLSRNLFKFEDHFLFYVVAPDVVRLFTLEGRPEYTWIRK